LRAVTLLRNTDRGEASSSSTFRIGSNVIYKCERGFRLDGRNSRVCDESGQWTGEVAICTCKKTIGHFMLRLSRSISNPFPFDW
jgi:hypothetical protein